MCVGGWQIKYEFKKA